MKTLINIFIGASGSGKTSYIEKEIIKGQSGEDIFINGLKMHKVNDIILFGHYNVDRRCKGCDTLSMSAIDNIILTLNGLILEDKYSLIILDGDRINNKKMLNFLIQYKNITKIYHVNTDLEKIYQRLPNGNRRFIKATQTKTNNMILNLKSNGFDIIIVDNNGDIR